MPAGILESMVLRDREGAELSPPSPVYGRRFSAETDEAVAALVGFQVAREVFDLAWSAPLAAALPKVATVEKGGLVYRLDSYSRTNQREFRVFLAAAR